MAVAHPVAVSLESDRLSHQMDNERQLRDSMPKYYDHDILEQISQGQLTGNDLLTPHETRATILFSDNISFTKSFCIQKSVCPCALWSCPSS